MANFRQKHSAKAALIRKLNRPGLGLVNGQHLNSHSLQKPQSQSVEQSIQSDGIAADMMILESAISITQPNESLICPPYLTIRNSATVYASLQPGSSIQPTMEDIKAALLEAWDYNMVLEGKFEQIDRQFPEFCAQVDAAHNTHVDFVLSQADTRHTRSMNVLKENHAAEKKDLLDEIKMLKKLVPKIPNVKAIPAYLTESDDQTEEKWGVDTDTYLAFLTATSKKSFDKANAYLEYTENVRVVPSQGQRPAMNKRCRRCIDSQSHMDASDERIAWYWNLTKESALKMKQILLAKERKIAELEGALKSALEVAYGVEDADLPRELVKARDDAIEECLAMKRERDEAVKKAASADAFKKSLDYYKGVAFDCSEAEVQRGVLQEELKKVRQQLAVSIGQQKSCSRHLAAFRAGVINHSKAVPESCAHNEEVICVSSGSKEDAKKSREQILNTLEHYIASESSSKYKDESFSTSKETFVTPINDAQQGILLFLLLLACVSLVANWSIHLVPFVTSIAAFVGGRAAGFAEPICGASSQCKEIFFNRPKDYGMHFY